jgi:serine/threonine protein kinase
MGEVLVAADAEVPRRVALKRLADGRHHDPDSSRRFAAEAALTGELEHPGIVPVYSSGQDAEGRPSYALRLVEGETLQQARARHHAAGADLAGLRRLLGRFVQVCQTAAYAHSRGVVHRDLKPANVLLGPNGETLVLDGGLAQRLTDPPAEEAVFS